MFGWLKSLVIILMVIYMFAYVEQQSSGQGYLLGVPLFLYPARHRRFSALMLYMCQLCAYIFIDKYVSYCFFMMLAIFSTVISSGDSPDVDDDVQFKPYESEIRKFLMRRDPSKLHLVDDMLIKYNDDGKELLAVLQKEYDIKDELERLSYVRNVVRRGFN